MYTLYHRTSVCVFFFSFSSVDLNFIFIWLLHLLTLSLSVSRFVFCFISNALFSALTQLLWSFDLLRTVTRFDWGNKRMLTLVDKSLLEHIQNSTNTTERFIERAKNKNSTTTVSTWMRDAMRCEQWKNRKKK